ARRAHRGGRAGLRHPSRPGGERARRGPQPYARARAVFRRPNGDAMTDLLRDLKCLVVDVLHLEEIKPEDIGDDTPLFADDGLGLDSIDALELGVALQKKYRLKFERGD